MDEDDKKLLEAALFAAGEPVSVTRLSEVFSQSPKYVQSLMEGISEDYDSRESPIEVASSGEMFVMQLRSEYGDKVRAIAPREFDTPVIRTLSVIAYNQPIKQSEVVSIRGNKAYEHIRELEEKGLISAEASGHTKIISTTDAFARYFDLPENDPGLIRSKLESEEL